MKKKASFGYALAAGLGVVFAGLLAACGDINDAPKALSREAAVSAFILTAPESVVGTVGVLSPQTQGGGTVSVNVLEGTDLGELRGKFTVSSGATVLPDSDGETWTYSGDQDKIATFAVTSEDRATTANWNVKVSTFTMTSKEITAFSLSGSAGMIDQSALTIRVAVADTANITALGAVVSHTGASISPDPASPCNWTDPVEFTVTDRNGGTKKYTVTVVRAAPAARNITAFSIDSRAGTIDQTNRAITVTLPFGTTPGTHTPVVAIEGASYRPTGAVNFSASESTPVSYFVRDISGSEAEYTVKVVQAASDAKSITGFTFSGLEPAAVQDMIEADINETAGTIAVTVPSGVLTSNLTPQIAHTGASIDTYPATGGATDFSGTVTYRVTAADNTTKDYVVTVTNAAPIAVTLQSVAGDSASAGTATQTLTFTFSAPLTTLTANFIDLDPAAGGALTAGALTPRAVVDGGVDYAVWDLAVS
ncbi:MAG: DUF5018 domain-containing protein, partial [Spirochaetaceae bacterium]|nr:DUF5018 domain-containing protein [Spirochaetaceae bacterium]